jgi:hypothetical protein
MQMLDPLNCIGKSELKKRATPILKRKYRMGPPNYEPATAIEITVPNDGVDGWTTDDF